MTTDIDPIKLSTKIIAIYEKYLENPADEDNRDWILSIHVNYVLASDLLDGRLALPLNELVYLAVDGPDGYRPDAKKINSYIAGLRQLIAELESKQ